MQDKHHRPRQMEIQLERALSHSRRAEIVDYLKQRGAGVEESELVGAFDLPVSRVRYHLAVLRSVGLVAHVEDREPGTTGRYIAAA